MIYPNTKLGRFLRHRSEFITIDDTSSYKRLRVQLHGKGVVLRDEVPGSDIKTKQQQTARPDDFLVAEIDAKVGGFGIVPSDLDGAIVSSHYFLFQVDDSVCVPGWLDAYVRSGRLEDQVTARGSTNYAAIRPAHVLDFEIPLPSLPEQRRIVARIERISTGVAEVLNLRQAADLGADLLLSLMAHRPDLDAAAKRQQGWIEISLGEITHQSQDRCRVVPDGSYPNLGIYSFGRGLFKKPPIEGARTSALELYRVRAGQFIYSRLFAFEGAYGLVSPEFDGHFVSGEYPTFDCDALRVLPEFLEAYFRFPPIWPEVAAGSKGLGDRRQRVQPAKLLAHRLMVPPLSTQEQISRINVVLRKTKPVRDLSSAELSALLPASLERAFAGGL